MRIKNGYVSISLQNLKNISLCFIKCHTVYQFLFPISQVWYAYYLTS